MEGETVKKERPQNKNLKPLGSGLLSPEEELAIRRKGKKACDEARRRNADMRAAVRAIANLNSKGKGKSVDVESLKTVGDLTEKDTPLIAHVVYAQFVKAMNGDIESRDWICRMLGADSIDEDSVTIPLDGENSGAGVRIQLVRGMKPPAPDVAAPESAADEGTATRDAGASDAAVIPDD